MRTYTRNILMIMLCVCAAVCFALAGCKKAGSDITILDWEDERITRRIYEAGALLGIALLDHIIIGDNCFISLKEQGLFQ